CCVTLLLRSFSFRVFFFNDTATTEIYTLSLHDALPILEVEPLRRKLPDDTFEIARDASHDAPGVLFGRAGGIRRERFSPHEEDRSEEHTSELQSRGHLVCRLLLEKKNKPNTILIRATII